MAAAAAAVAERPLQLQPIIPMLLLLLLMMMMMILMTTMMMIMMMMMMMMTIMLLPQLFQHQLHFSSAAATASDKN